MEIAVTVILRKPSEYTQRKQSIDMTGCKAVIIQKVKVSLDYVCSVSHWLL